MIASVCIVFLMIGAVLADDENQAKLRYYRDSIEKYTELPFDEAHNIFSLSWYNSSRTTVIFGHGYTGRPLGPAVTAVIKVYLEQGQYNVILLNWDRLAAQITNQLASSYFNWAAPNAAQVGADFGDVLGRLSRAGLDLNKTHLIGHSLGAHIMGIAGNKLVKRGIRLPWITGLDPAGIVFDSKPESDKLNSFSAGFVSVIHTDPSKYGSRKRMGTVDFWPNYRNVGPVIQAGCGKGPHPRFSPEDLCSHHRGWQYLVDAVYYPGTLLGSHAKNFRVWRNYSNQQRTAVVLEIGKYYKNVVPGNYYLMTTAPSPYGLGENGL